jgi:type II secretory pathway component PulF
MSAIQDWLDKIGAADRIEFYDFIVTLLDSGKSLLDTMGQVASTIEKQADQIIVGKGALLKQAKLYRFVEQGLREGKALHIILAGRVPDSELMMIMAGGKGDLKQGLRSAKTDAIGKAAMRKSVISGLTYPIILAFAVVGSISWVGTNLMPTLVMLQPVERWTPAEQNLYWLSGNVGLWFPIVLAVIISYVVIMVLINKTIVGDLREKIHSIPPLNIVRRITAASMLTTLASLLRSGETLKVSLQRVQQSSGSAYMRSYVEKALTNIRIGLAAKGPGKAIGSKLFSPPVMVKLEIYGEGEIGQFATKLNDIADTAREEAMGTINRAAKITSFVLMSSAAGVIGFTVLMMFSITGSMTG